MSHKGYDLKKPIHRTFNVIDEDYYNQTTKAQLDAREDLNVIVKAAIKHLHDYALSKGYFPGAIIDVSDKHETPVGVGFHFTIEYENFSDAVIEEIAETERFHKMKLYRIIMTHKETNAIKSGGILCYTVTDGASYKVGNPTVAVKDKVSLADLRTNIIDPQSLHKVKEWIDSLK